MTSVTTKTEELTDEMAEEAKALAEQLTAEIQTIIVGQKPAIRRILVGLLAKGHILLELSLIHI